MRRHTDAIVIHCADTPTTMHVGVDEIRKWHLEKGWSDVGYHYVIRRNGLIEKGRDQNAVGAHVKGFNEVTLGICLMGGWQGKFDFTRVQMNSLEYLIITRLEDYPKAVVKGHRDYDNKKQCPGFDVQEWWYDGVTQP